MGDFGVVGEGGCEGAALLLAEGGEGWVGDGVVCGIEVVEALGVADEEEVCFRHNC